MALVFVALVSCASTVQPEAYTHTTKASQSEVFDCTNGMLNQAGFTLDSASKESGFLKAERKVSGIGRVLMVGASLFDVVTASVYSDPTTKQTTLRITADSVNEREGLFAAGHRTSSHPRQELVEEVSRVLSTCAK
jgi:hypothetical protein